MSIGTHKPTAAMRPPQVSVADRVYGEIRAHVAGGQYQPHQRLVEAELGEKYGASRTPVRQALQRLELEGLVTASRHGWIVRMHTVHEIHRVYEIRMALEGYASRLAAERATAEALEQIAASHEKLLKTLSPRERNMFVSTHDDLHGSIFRAADNELLHLAIDQYRGHPYNRRIAQTYSEEELQATAQSHSQVVRAICDGDADRAEQLTREHLALARDATVRRIALPD